MSTTWEVVGADGAQPEAKVADGAQPEALSTSMQHIEELVQKIQEKASFMEKRSNYMGHDAEMVLKRELVQECAQCLAVKMQQIHAHGVKMAMLQPVRSNAAQLEFASKTWKITEADIKAALERMELLHKLQVSNTNRIGMEKPGDLCQLLKSCSWVYIYIYIYIYIL